MSAPVSRAVLSLQLALNKVRTAQRRAEQAALHPVGGPGRREQLEASAAKVRGEADELERALQIVVRVIDAARTAPTPVPANLAQAVADLSA